VDKKIPSGRKPLDSVRNEIEKILTANIEKDSQQRWLAKLKKDAYVEINLPN
jgi:parvulin-like peptidyl-prolyl isomerase